MNRVLQLNAVVSRARWCVVVAMMFACGVFSTGAHGQMCAGWEQLAVAPRSRIAHAMAYDAARREVVLFGGVTQSPSAETWVYDGVRWEQRFPETSPSARAHHAMVYDSVRRRVVLFGGDGNLNDTWEWNGTTWRLASTSGPPGRSRHAMAFDSERGRTVLFGGQNTGFLGDTWEWDGDSWHFLNVGTVPGRRDHVMAYDSLRRRVVMHGGRDQSGLRSDTLEWNGSQWLFRIGSGGPGTREESAMIYDDRREKIVLFGGMTNSRNNDTWTWDGTQWELVATEGPEPRNDHSMVYDTRRNVAIMFGGSMAVGAALGATWQWDGQGWNMVAGGPGPGGVERGSMVFDPWAANLLLLTTNGEAWRMDGLGWFQSVSPTSTPTIGRAMAVDTARQRIVAFGGWTANGYQSTMHEWTGTVWQERAGPGPVPRLGHAMAYDHNRQRVVLFGGFNGDYLGDTWEWSGASWTLRNTITGGRAYHAMTNDARRGRVITVGGQGILTMVVWIWNGTTWDASQNLPGPLPRNGHSFVYDESRGVCILFGGYDGRYRADTWLYDGREWFLLLDDVHPFPGRPAPRMDHAMAYDAVRGRMTIFGGYNGTTLDDTWVLNLNMPSITQQPVDIVVTEGRAAEFSVTANGAGTLTYQWRRSTQALSNTSPFSGVDTDRLIIDPVTRDEAGIYNVLVSNGSCSPAFSRNARLTVTCRADCDHSTGVGVLDVFDFLCFGSAFASGDPWACDCDQNTGPGVCDIFDFLCFQDAFAQGC